MAAKEISSLMPIFQEHGIRLVGIGLEPIGMEEFIAGNFFKGGKREICKVIQNMCLINDPLGQADSPDHYYHLKVVLFCEILKSGD